MLEGSQWLAAVCSASGVEEQTAQAVLPEVQVLEVALD
jgi:hypothetical protein